MNISKNNEAKRASELVIAKKEKAKRASELVIANKELLIQNKLKEKKAAELVVANRELVIQNKLKEKRAAELVIANKELAYQNREKEKRARELVIANKELAYQNREKEKRADELIIANYARSMIEASLDPLVTISPKGKITDVNEATIIVTGIHRDKLLGTDFSNYFTEPKKARLGYKKVLKEGFVSNYPLTIRGKEGKETDVLYNASLYKDEKGNVLGIFAAARDVTEQKEIDVMKDDLISLTGHELKTPLVSITSVTQLIGEGKLGPINDKQKKYLALVLSDGRRLNGIVQNMLDTSRLEHGRVAYEMKEFDLNALINESIMTADSLAREKKIKIKFAESTPLKIIADRVRIGQTILNIITNGIKYGKRTILLSSMKKGSDVIISFKDDGIGITKENQPHIFEKMFQVSRGDRRTAGGVGFGLYLSKKIVEEGHHGKLWFESAIGKGTTFYISLPVHQKK